VTEYAAAKAEPFRGHPVHQNVRDIRIGFQREVLRIGYPTVKVRASVGMGNWATIPWVGFLDTRETPTTRNGVYVIALFCADMSGCYLTLNQGVVGPMERQGRVAARIALQKRADAIRERLGNDLIAQGFELSGSMDLGGSGSFSNELTDSTIAHRFFFTKERGFGERMLSALKAALALYDRYLAEPIPLGGSPRPY
jgi:hypothetical protein